MTATALAASPDYRGRSAARLEDLEWLIRMGLQDWEVFPRLGFSSAGAAEKFARRNGRGDLAVHFAALATAERRAREREEVLLT